MKKTGLKYLLLIAAIAVSGCSVSPDAERFSQQEPTAERLAPTNSLNPALEDSWDEHGIQRMIHALKDSTTLQEEAMELGHLLTTLEIYYSWEVEEAGKTEDPLGKLFAATTLKYYATNTHQGLLDIIHNRAFLKELLDYFTLYLSETERTALTEAIEKHDLTVIKTQIDALYVSFTQDFIRVYHRDGIRQTGTEQTFPADYDDSDIKILTEADSPIRKAVIRLITTLIQKYYDIPEEEAPKASETEPSETPDLKTKEETAQETELPAGTYIAKNIAHKTADGQPMFTYELQLSIGKQSASEYTLKALRLVDQNSREEILTFPAPDADPKLLSFDPKTKKLYFKIGATDAENNLFSLHFEGVLHADKDKTVIEGKFTITKEDHTILSQSSWTAELGAAPGPDVKTEAQPEQPPAAEEKAEEAPAAEPAAEENAPLKSTDSGEKTAHPKTELPVGTYIAKNVEYRAATTGKLLFTYELQLRITRQSDNGATATFINFLKLRIINQNGKERVITFPDDFDSTQPLIPFDPETQKIDFVLKIPATGNSMLLLHFEGLPRFNQDEAVIEGTFTVTKEDGTILSQSSWTAELILSAYEKTETLENKEKPAERKRY